MHKFHFTIAVTAFLFAAVLAQSTNGITLINTGEGILWVDNGGTNNFTLEIKGKDIGYKRDANMVKAGEVVFQIHRVSLNELYPTPTKTRPSDEEILQAHQLWEVKYIKETVQKKITLRTESLNEKIKRGGLLWAYSMVPRAADEIYEQVFLTTVNNDGVIVLSGPVFKEEDREVVVAYLTQTLATLQTSTTPFDIPALQKKLRTVPPPKE